MRPAASSAGESRTGGAAPQAASACASTAARVSLPQDRQVFPQVEIRGELVDRRLPGADGVGGGRGEQPRGERRHAAACPGGAEALEERPVAEQIEVGRVQVLRLGEFFPRVRRRRPRRRRAARGRGRRTRWLVRGVCVPSRSGPRRNPSQTTPASGAEIHQAEYPAPPTMPMPSRAAMPTMTSRTVPMAWCRRSVAACAARRAERRSS